MIKVIHPAEVEGEITAPPSKSMTQRAFAAALLAKGTTTIINPSGSDDSLAALGMTRKLGAEVVAGNGNIIISGGFLLPGAQLHCGESGLAMRMFASIAALQPEQITFTGEGSLNKRPVSMIEEALKQLGVNVKSNNGLLPFSVQGPLQGGKAVIDGSVSSQLLTGLLMALPMAENDSEIHVINLKSKSYIAMTLQLLGEFGIIIENHNFELFKIHGNQPYRALEYTVEGDWSGAAFLLVAGAVNGNIRVKGLHAASKQSDMTILDALQNAGAYIKLEDDTVSVSKSVLSAFRFDATECPDLFPPLAALAAYCAGITRILGVNRLIYKESNRAVAIQEEMRKLGITVRIEGDEMLITGGKIRRAFVHSHHDHRIAMMAAVAAISADGYVTIKDAECVAKSYPGFFNDLEKLGMEIGG
ncbi:MAG: 3-phosphoshikimate 1-carboxyvinyltransferase [Bacteroidales bacterium]|nr:3-phosphoshikimate 1-carboxyvinyltransferase [Bacteroidales bacterium]MDZ4204814.1 3-phosphoshikimate 1-carboxyvinyltransferase [Bacteroidales bacterium]